MNPFTYFMQLSPKVKMTLIICLTLVLLSFMYFAFESGAFGDIVAYFFNKVEAKK